MIEDYHFGSITIRNKHYREDLKIIRGEVFPKWWRQEGHTLDIADVDDILSAKPEMLVVGTGHAGRMQVTRAVRSALAEAKIALMEEPTTRAVEIFNRLHSQGKKVAGAFHLTC